MANHNENYLNACFSVFMGLIIFIVAFVTVPTYVIPYFEGLELEEISCYVDNISYPISNPTFDNYDNWKECDCGKRCISYSPCIKLFTNNTFIHYTYPTSKDECSFHEEKCPSGEDIRNIEKYLNEANQTFYEYIHTNHSCYINRETNEIYLNKNTSFTDMLVSLIFLGLFVICCCSVVIYIEIENCLEKRTIERANKEKEISNA